MPKRNRRQSLTERLQYWGERSGVVVNRQKQAEICVGFDLPSAAEVTDGAREQLAEAVRMIMIQAVPQRCRGRIIIESAPVSDDEMLRVNREQHMGNDLLSFLASEDARAMEESRVRGELSTWRYYFTLRLDTKRRRSLVPVSFTETELQALVQRGVQMRKTLVNMLNAAGFPAWEVLGQEACSLMYRWFNPGLASGKPPMFKSMFRPPNVPLKQLRGMFQVHSDTLRAQIAHSDIDTSRIDALVVGDRFVQTVNMLSPGDSTYPGMTERMLRRLSGHHVYLVIDLNHLYQPDVRKKLNNAARGAQIAATDGSLGTPDVGNSAVLDNISNVLYQLTQAEEHVFEFGISMVLIARDKAELEHMKEIAQTEMSMMGGTKSVYGTVQNIPQYLDRLAPLNGQDNDFMFKCFSINVAHMVPLVGPWQGSRRPVAVMRSRWGSLTGLNPSDGTLNYGTLLMGSAGSGKTFLTQGWAARTGAQNAEFIIVDQKRDYESFIASLGDEGQFIPFAPGQFVNGQVVRYNAFELPAGVIEPDDEHKLFLLGFVTALLGDKDLNGIEKAVVTAAIEAVYVGAVSYNNRGDPEYTPVTLSKFVRALKNLNAVGTESLRRFDQAQQTIKHLSLALQTYIGDTPMGIFLDGESTVRVNAKYVYFDLSKIRAQKDLTRIALLLVIQQIWARAKADPDQVIVPIIEEIGVLFKIEAARDFVAALYKLGRTYNLWPVGITQEIGDFQLGKGLVNNSSQFIIGQVSAEEAAIIADVLGLNEAAHNLILSLSGEKGRYREFLVIVNKESGMTGDVVRYFPNKVEYWLFTSAPAERAHRDRTVALYGGNTLEAVRALAGAV
ncbi:VirB4 family type IV secretion system protein [Deinococcus multiflagellatus]|uniref:VirB4 family type IV secretion system protein n=1 Tax=Deinococcus multiflagellatus TaxID=1656887 RepID=A0ABW1ZQZ9_9DEIO|nr:type IV secretion system protein VirB4 [Deinococcus multiflagellatus]MBZ9714962.1 type IV secretion system protein VirB4 [Deinococcus multiflagellatus]